MMDSIATIKTTTAQRGTVWKWVGISVMCGVLVVLIVIGVVTVVRRRRDTKGKQPDAEKDAGKSTEKATKKDTGKSARSGAPRVMQPSRTPRRRTTAGRSPLQVNPTGSPLRPYP